MNDRLVLWDRDSGQVQSTIRQPRNFAISSNTSEQSTQQNSVELNNSNVTSRNEPSAEDSVRELEQLVRQSKLNVDAMEWYPPDNVYTNRLTNTPSSIQNRLKVYKLPTETVEHNLNECSDEFSSDLHRIKQIISTLTKDPGQFHDLLDLFMETLEPYLEDIMGPSLVATIIVEQAIHHPNFRYTGARLCWLIEQHSPRFRAELHLKCIKQIEENPDTKNVLLVIAELYTQLPHLSVYGVLLIQAFNKLLDIGGNDNIKSICQALKLTGFYMERSNKLDLDKIIDDLKSVRGIVDGSAASLLESIFQLRATNWGHSSEESSDSEQDSDVPFEGLQSKMIYDFEGETLTREESDFIATHISPEDEYGIDDFDPDELCDPEPEMDEEIQEAFKEFVKLSGKH